MTITTHVLDTSIGRPARAVGVRLERREDDGSWREISEAVTNDDGRVAALVPSHLTAGVGVYRLTFESGAYFASRGVLSFYPRVSVEFHVQDASSHYHVPLLVSPFGYSTYRGS